MSDKLTRADVAAIIRLRSLDIEVNLRMDHEDQIIALAATGPEPIKTYRRCIVVGDKVRMVGGSLVGRVINWRENGTRRDLQVEFNPPDSEGMFKIWVDQSSLELVNET